METTQDFNKPSNINGIDKMAIEIFKTCTTPDEKASIKVGGHKYTSETTQKGSYIIVTIKKDSELFCISIYNETSGYKDHYEVRA